jgi:hypothetical protein
MRMMPPGGGSEADCCDDCDTDVTHITAEDASQFDIIASTIVHFDAIKNNGGGDCHRSDNAASSSADETVFFIP